MSQTRKRHGILTPASGKKGQGITEYGLIILLAGIALVTALGAFGGALADQFDSIVSVVISL